MTAPPGIPLADTHLLCRLRGSNWWLLAFTGPDLGFPVDRFRARLRAAIHGRPFIREHIVSPAADAELADPDLRLHSRYGLNQPGLYLLRPDGHIAFRSEGPGIDPLSRYLDKNFRG